MGWALKYCDKCKKVYAGPSNKCAACNSDLLVSNYDSDVYATLSCTIRINGTPVPHERYKRFAPTVRYPFLRLFIGSKFLMFFPFISKRYDSLRTRARLASA